MADKTDGLHKIDEVGVFVKAVVDILPGNVRRAKEANAN